MNTRSKPSFTRQPKVTKGWEAVRINIVRVFLGTIDGLLYFELNFKGQMPPSWLRWTHHLLRTVGRHTHTGLWDGQDETHTLFPWLHGENSWKFVFFFLIGTWYQSPGWNSVLFSDDLPVLVRCHREILGQNHYRSTFVNAPARRDLVHPPWCSGLRAVSRGGPRKVGATWSDAAISKLESWGPWHALSC